MAKINTVPNGIIDFGAASLFIVSFSVPNLLIDVEAVNRPTFE